MRSTRKLETACREQLSLLWLTGLIPPDHNSLWRFWRDHKKALRQIFKQTVQVAARPGALGLALQALDGTKIQAAGRGPKGWSQESREKLLAQLDAALEEMELSLVEANAAVDQPGSRLPAGRAQRQALREEIKNGLAQLEAEGRHHYHPVEPEARRRQVGDPNRYADNVQALADAPEGIRVACAATRQETDAGQLVPMIQQARENWGVAATNPVTVADPGDGAGADLPAAAENGMSVLGPPAEGKPARDTPYAPHHFDYDPQQRSVTCPQGRTLAPEGHTTQNGVRGERVRCPWRDCPVRAHCTGDPKGRQIEIRPHAASGQAMRQRLTQPAARRQWQQRAKIIEPRFGQIKQHDGLRRWTVWGLEAVKTQWTMVWAPLNLRLRYRRWQAGPDPEKESPLPVLSLKTAIRASTPSAGLQNQLALWWQKRWSLPVTRSRVRPTGFPLAFAFIL